MGWQRTLIDRLLAAANDQGGWGYRPQGPTGAEPTAIACLALRAHGVAPDRWEPGLASLAALQRPDGGVPVVTGTNSPCWATGLAVMAWTLSETPSPHPYRHQVDRGIEWLLARAGRTYPRRLKAYGHDPKLRGWPWVEGTHSWVEPTAYATLALRTVDQADHARTREAVALLWDRAFSDGGWNYGNTRVFSNTLDPFPGTSGIALAALAGEPDESRAAPSIAYLSRELAPIRSPVSLSWGVIGLSLWNARPAEADAWLARSAASNTVRVSGPLEDGLLLLADATRGSLALAANGKGNGSRE